MSSENAKHYSYPRPEHPNERAEHALWLVACLILFDQHGSYRFAIAAMAVFAALYSWFRSKRAYKIAILKWQLANAQGWVRHFAEDVKEGPPWFHSLAIPEDADGSQFVSDAKGGFQNWSETVKELEAKLEFVASRWWRM
jgi:hypothetical protein